MRLESFLTIQERVRVCILTPVMYVGWATTIITMNSFGKMVRSKRFMAPDGRFCSSRDDALK
jgi:hypothetical protein